VRLLHGAGGEARRLQRGQPRLHLGRVELAQAHAAQVGDDLETDDLLVPHPGAGTQAAALPVQHQPAQLLHGHRPRPRGDRSRWRLAWAGAGPEEHPRVRLPAQVGEEAGGLLRRFGVAGDPA
jgi:hypothetical protein